mmetsp:Transcript_22744/g.56518  ORF Transcript_22744/g.56518 Transcript_22744/m.56518 type:complete len:147 (+) Transcript_22744:1181-1621(+)
MLEVNSLKLAYNKSLAECTAPVGQALFSSVLQAPDTSQAALSARIASTTASWTPLVARFTATSSDQLEFLRGLQKFLTGEGRALAAYAGLMLQGLYGADVLGEEAVSGWAAGLGGADADAGAALKAAVEPFVAWLADAEEESSEEE